MIRLLLSASAATVVMAGSITVGSVRVSALSPTLVRLEPRGPRGFEDRPTFNAVGSISAKAAGLPVTILNTSAAGTWLATSAYRVYLPTSATAPQGPDHRVCAPEDHTDIDGGATRLAKYANGTTAAGPEACCALCLAEPDCVAWVAASTGDRSRQQGMNCWPFSQVGATRQTKAGRTFGYASPQSLVNGFVDATIVTPDGARVLWQGSTPTPVAANELHWPSPLANSSYVSTDSLTAHTSPASGVCDDAWHPRSGYWWCWWCWWCW
jgi:hypothetical protein